MGWCESAQGSPHGSAHEAEQIRRLLSPLLGREQAAAILRSLIERIVLHPGRKRGEPRVELRGQLAPITNLARPVRPGQDVMITMVAEEGLEPPTRGL